MHVTIYLLPNLFTNCLFVYEPKNLPIYPERASRLIAYEPFPAFFPNIDLVSIRKKP